jgi:glutamine phosphoribosylpyrophosphate amidotransferase
MCAIVGFVGDDYTALAAVFQESRVRGLHAFGYAYGNGKEIVVRKFETLHGLKFQLLKDRPKSLVGHCRYSTSGDWKDPRNNQPIVRFGRALVFNGVIDMGTKEEMERRHGVDLETENDGELALWALNKWSDVRSITPKQSFAGLWTDASGVIHVARNERRPAWVGQVGETTIIASTADILERAGINHRAELPVGQRMVQSL